MTSGITPTSLKQASQLQMIIDRLVQPALLKKEPLIASEIKFLIESIKKQLKKSPSALVEIEAPQPDTNEILVICGDTHGQYRDVLRMLDMKGFPPKTTYLFLGDYVDRGRRGVEVACLMFAFKLAFPKKFFVLRGNHEAKEINKFYGFFEEVTSRYSEQLWIDFNEAFTWLPLAALIGKTIFCMHGGIPAKTMKDNMDEIRNLEMPIQSPRDNEIVADLLWSDPSEDVDSFVPNPRGLGHQFGIEQVNDFITRHTLQVIIRAHQVFHAGYKFFGHHLITVFSAPNYGGEFENNASCVVLTNSKNQFMVKLDILKPYHRNK